MRHTQYVEFTHFNVFNARYSCEKDTNLCIDFNLSETATQMALPNGLLKAQPSSIHCALHFCLTQIFHVLEVSRCVCVPTINCWCRLWYLSPASIVLSKLDCVHVKRSGARLRLEGHHVLRGSGMAKCKSRFDWKQTKLQ